MTYLTHVPHDNVDLPSGHRWIDLGRRGRRNTSGDFQCADCMQIIGAEYTAGEHAELYTDELKPCDPPNPTFYLDLALFELRDPFAGQAGVR